jgi:hypothetical protein
MSLVTGAASGFAFSAGKGNRNPFCVSQPGMPKRPGSSWARMFLVQHDPMGFGWLLRLRKHLSQDHQCDHQDQDDHTQCDPSCAEKSHAP